MLDHTLMEAKRIGIGIDLANGTGWPFGGPWIEGIDAAHGALDGALARVDAVLAGGVALVARRPWIAERLMVAGEEQRLAVAVDAVAEIGHRMVHDDVADDGVGE